MLSLTFSFVNRNICHIKHLTFINPETAAAANQCIIVAVSHNSRLRNTEGTRYMTAIIQTALHFIANWFFNSICIYACSRWFSRIVLIPDDNMPLYILVLELGLILTLLNLLIRPVLLHLLLPLNGITVGFLSLVINGLSIFLLSRFSDSFLISSVWVGILATFVFAILNIILQILIPIDDDVMIYSSISQRARSKKTAKSREKGLVMLEIDGLSFSRLIYAIKKGYMPFLREQLDSGAYTVRPYDCGIPSQTSSCQAGIMFGRNENICAFRWYDKKNRKVYTSSNSGNANEMEKMLFPEGEPAGILDNGISINNIMSGNAEENILTISQMLPKSKEEQKKRNQNLYRLSIRPYLLTKALILTVVDAGSEVLAYLWDCIRRKEPRLNRLHKFYPFVRGGTNILLREISAAMVVDAIAAGRESMYTTFIGYDEIAHHSGPDSASAYHALTGIDTAIRKIFEAAAISASRPYEIVILSDHGQTFGATFKQRYGTTLGDYIKSLSLKHSLIGKALRVLSLGADEDNSANVMALFDSLSTDGPDAFTRKAAETLGNAVTDSDLEKVIKSAENEANDILVLASGNLVNVYFSVSEDRMTYEGIEAVYPGMISEMISHPGIGLILVHSGEGPIAIGKDGKRNLSSGELTGEDPLVMYGDPEKRSKQLHYLSNFPNGGDLVIISPVYEDGSVAAYEELIGSHGGLGGQQTDPFLMHASAIEVGEEIINANQIYPVLQKIKNTPVSTAEDAGSSKDADTTSVKAMWRQIQNTKHWAPVLLRTLYFSPDAYKTVAWDASFNGPSILIGAISFVCIWIAMNSRFSYQLSPLGNFAILALNYGIAILSGYLSVVAMRGKKEPWKLGRAFLFTSVWGVLSLFVLTNRAVNVWTMIVLLLLINALASSAFAAGKLKRKQIVPLFLVLLLLIPVLSIGSLMLYSFITYPLYKGI